MCVEVIYTCAICLRHVMQTSGAKGKLVGLRIMDLGCWMRGFGFRLWGSGSMFWSPTGCVERIHFLRFTFAS